MSPSDGSDHRVVVDLWLARVDEVSSSPAWLIEAFESALGALWRRASVTLGEVTLSAVLDRVLVAATGRFPLVGSLRMENGGPSADALRARGAEVDRNELEAAIRCVLTDFLTVLGSLTAEILTPLLHTELSKLPSGQDVHS
jgi:hypothetical protein